MLDRFYVETSLDAETVEIDGPEAHHLLKVLRLGPEAPVALFDGRGNEATAEVLSTSKKSATVRVLQRRRDSDDERPRCVLATAVPKGDRFRWLVEKATELGVDRLVPLQTRRSVVDPRSAKLEKMRQAVIAACKQSGRNRLMEITATADWDEFLRGRERGRTLFLAHPGGEPLAGALEEASPAGIDLAVGPEGGFTDEEIDAARAAEAVPVNLGPHILRVETAAIALAACVRLLPPGHNRTE